MLSKISIRTEKRIEMKRYGVIFSIFAIISAVYATISLLLTNDKNDVFWVGFGLILFSIVLVAIITGVSTKKRTSAFPLDNNLHIFIDIYSCGAWYQCFIGQHFNSEMKCLSAYISCALCFMHNRFDFICCKGGIVKKQCCKRQNL